MRDVPGPLRVLMLNYEFPPLGGGTGIACRHLLRAIGRLSDVRVDLVTSGMGSRLTVARPSDNVTIRRLPVGKKDAHFWRPLELIRWTVHAYRLAARMTRRDEYDFCHCWAGWPPGLVGYALRGRLPYVVALRGSDVPGFSPRLERLDPLVFERVSRRVWREATAVVSVSRQLRDLAHRTLPDLEIPVIPNGTDTTRFTPGDYPDSFTVLFVGRLVPRKRAIDVVEAFALVAERVEDARLVVVGDGPVDARLQSRVRDLGLERAVRFLGHIPYDELPPIYRRASVFALTSLREGMPNVVLEAMASGLPIVATDATGSLLDGNGTAVPVGDRSAIAEALVRYAREPGLRAAHGRQSRELAEGSSWDRVAGWYVDLYREVARRADIGSR